MLRIGEAAKKFDISNRTLRYWEEMGILKSVRTENSYRYYDGENAARINQIVLLRKLKMPISDIERVFIAADYNVAIDALTSHFESLKRDAAVYNTLIAVIEKLIQHIKEAQNMDQVFSFLETHDALIDSSYMSVPQNQLSERAIIMSNECLNNVRIVRIPKMTVASYCPISERPELDCHEVMTKFIKGNRLHLKNGFRHFGFNNPCPSENNPIYGYEIWVAVPDDFEVPAPLAKKQFLGGLYASVSTQLNEIGERWQQLTQWAESNDTYMADETLQWLEECVDFETFTANMGNDSVQQLDLLIPIKLK
ncbi:MAG: effector binding domain-containing protein [Clostridiaceae bacterium]|nr:effector binding domain-containing protein [Clostridiaceae bacterium]